MTSHMLLFFLIPKICRTSFRWINHCCHPRPRLFLNGWKSMHVPGVDKCVDCFVKTLKKRKPMLHSITRIEISCLCITVFVFFRLSRSNTDEEALMIICVRSCSGKPLFFSSVAICWGTRRLNFKLGT